MQLQSQSLGPPGSTMGLPSRVQGPMGRVGDGDGDGARVAALNDFAVCLVVEVVFVFPDEDVGGAV